jgi:hypothetical protein
MGKPGSELLVYGLIIAGFLLFNYFAQKLARKAREQRAAAEQAAAQAPPEEAAEQLEDIWSRARAAQLATIQVPEQRAPMPAAAPPPPAATRRLFRSRQDLRHAIVLMTVLGPCRALEPHEQR